MVSGEETLRHRAFRRLEREAAASVPHVEYDPALLCRPSLFEDIPFGVENAVAAGAVPEGVRKDIAWSKHV